MFGVQLSTGRPQNSVGGCGGGVQLRSAAETNLTRRTILTLAHASSVWRKERRGR
jgi:hypothetical protein